MMKSIKYSMSATFAAATTAYRHPSCWAAGTFTVPAALKKQMGSHHTCQERGSDEINTRCFPRSAVVPCRAVQGPVIVVRFAPRQDFYAGV